MGRDQELYGKAVDSVEAHAYLAILPWRREARVTVVLGFVGGADERTVSDLRAALAQVHRIGVEESLEFAMPKAPAERGSGESKAWYSKEYDWVVTDGYVGPDRRARPTRFLSRYLIFGQRRGVLRNLPVEANPFVDRLKPEIATLAFAYILLSVVDTVFTWWFVSRGIFSELNPLLRALLSSNPLAFVAVKNLMSLTALLVIVRFQLFRMGRAVLWINAAAYAILDTYWLYLIARRFIEAE
jgi:hypothetical protein